MDDLHEIFPDLELQVKFEQSTDEYIEVLAKPSGVWVPLEIAGTGVLQATQILSYIHRYKPSLIVLEEPDSHLHPNNQRLLCALMRKVSEERNIQVLLTTHSRHVVDALASSSAFLWVRNGNVEIASEDDEIGVLMELGALDIKERAGQPGTRIVVLTEDEITRPLEAILESSGFRMEKSAVLPYYGVTNVKQLQPLAKLIQSVNPKAKIVIHRDRDFMKEEEVEAWKKEVRALKCDPFVTSGRDIESYLLDPHYLTEINPGLTLDEINDAFASVVGGISSSLVADYVNSRVDFLRKNGASVNNGALANEAQKAINTNAANYCGKSALRALKSEVQARFKRNLQTQKVSHRLAVGELAVIARKLFGTN